MRYRLRVTSILPSSLAENLAGAHGLFFPSGSTARKLIPVATWTCLPTGGRLRSQADFCASNDRRGLPADGSGPSVRQSGSPFE